MVFSFLKRRRRSKLLAEPFPREWESVLREGYPQFEMIPAELQPRLRDRLRVFMAEKYWEGIDGFEPTDERQVIIAAMACTLTLAFEEDDALYSNVSRVLLFPQTITRQSHQRRDGFIVTEDEAMHLGEAWSTTNSLRGGVIALAWTDVVRGAQNPSDGRNVVFHEFAHALDMADGAVEGTPPLPTRDAEEAWANSFQREYESLRRQYEAGLGIPMDPYALTNLAEFLAVSTENYFERPRLLQLKLPALYAVLDTFYRLQPATW